MVYEVFYHCEFSFHFYNNLRCSMGFLGGSVVKNQLAIQEMQFPSLGGEDPLEEEMATYSSILAWKSP